MRQRPGILVYYRDAIFMEFRKSLGPILGAVVWTKTVKAEGNLSGNRGESQGRSRP